MIEHCTKEETDFLKKNICPDCKWMGFLEGPHGGLCVNVMCNNPRCGSRFNIGPLTSAGLCFGVDRISDPSPLHVSMADL